MSDGSRAAAPMIEADRLSKFYGPFAAVRNVSFQVRQGEVVAFLGTERRRQEHDVEAVDGIPIAVGGSGESGGARHGNRPH